LPAPRDGRPEDGQARQRVGKPLKVFGVKTFDQLFAYLFASYNPELLRAGRVFQKTPI
jgi:hypothetical protein